MMQVRRVVLALLLALIAAPLLAQSPAAIAGSVLDPDGKVVVDAVVMVRSDATGELRTTATDGRGHFSVTGLPSGSYSIEVAVPGLISSAGRTCRRPLARRWKSRLS